jgi:hypothetical protein
MLFLKSLVIWVVIAVAETLNGILRMRLLNRRLGDRRGRRVGVVTGSALILGIAWLMIPWTGVAGNGESLLVGLLWLALMLLYDFVIGRWVFHLPWRRMLADFDVRRGGFLGFGMLVLFFAPLIVAKWRGLF